MYNSFIKYIDRVYSYQNIMTHVPIRALSGPVNECAPTKTATAMPMEAEVVAMQPQAGAGVEVSKNGTANHVLAEPHNDASLHQVGDGESTSDNQAIPLEINPTVEQQVERLTNEITVLRAFVQQNPNDYSKHIHLVSLLRESLRLSLALNVSAAELRSIITSIRQIRETISKQYPLPPQVWLEWIQDEESYESMQLDNSSFTTFDSAGKFRLFERALMDYASAEIWLEYVKYAQSHYDTSSDRLLLRQLHQRAWMELRFHYYDAFRLYELIIAYERRILRALLVAKAHCGPKNKSHEDSDTSDSESESMSDEDESEHIDAMLEEQIERIRRIMVEMSRSPVLGNDTAFKEYERFLEQMKDIVTNIDFEQHKQGILARNERQPYEEAKIRSPNSESPGILSGNAVSAWLNYIEFERSCIPVLKSDSRLISTFERAIEAGFLHCELWKKYLDYLRNQKDDQRYSYICRRCIRNVPWVAVGWSSLIDALTRTDASPDEVEAIYQQSFTLIQPDEGAVQVCMSMFRYYTQVVSEEQATVQSSMQKIFQQAYNILVYSSESKQITFPAALFLDVFVSWIEMQAFRFEDFDGGRHTMEQLLKLCPLEVQCWQDCIEIEKRLFAYDNVRSLYYQACKALEPHPWNLELVSQQWLRFERLYGTKDHYIQALNWREKSLNLLAAQPAHHAPIEANKNQESIHVEISREAPPPKTENIAENKRISNRPIDHQRDNLKYSREAPQTKTENFATDKRRSMDHRNDKAAHQYSHKEDTRKRIRSDAQPISRQSDDQHFPKRDDPSTTVYVKQLPRTNDIEKLVLETFSKVGEVEDIRFGHDRKTGQLKNFAFVQFKETQVAERALALGEVKIHDHVVIIERVQVKQVKPFENGRQMHQESERQRKKTRLGVAPPAKLPDPAISIRQPTSSNDKNSLSETVTTPASSAAPLPPPAELHKCLSNADFRAMLFGKK